MCLSLALGLRSVCSMVKQLQLHVAAPQCTQLHTMLVHAHRLTDASGSLSLDDPLRTRYRMCYETGNIWENGADTGM